MASICNDSGGRRRIQFCDTDRVRRTVRLGKIAKRQAETVKHHVEQLVAAQITKTAPPDETARWLAALDVGLLDKLAKVGLVEARDDKHSRTLKEHLDHYLAARGNVKPSTRLNWGHTERCLLAFFGADREIASITVGDARDFEQYLRTPRARNHRYADRSAKSGLAPNTVRKRVSNAKQFFQDAVDREIIPRNPFATLKGGVGSNRERDFFVTREMAGKVLDACPDNQWRLLFALSRYAGLRCPSESLALRWADIDWDAGRMIVRSPKTEHHEGKGMRVAPIFAELRPYLEQAWDEAEDGAEFVITRYRSANANLRSQLQRIIARAGLAPWPKLFANLRASCATELAREHPAHVAAAWLGHSTLVANKHYWQVTDDDFERALGEAAQNAAQSGHAHRRTESLTESARAKKTVEMHDGASECDLVHKRSVGDTRLELVTSAV